MKLLLEDKEIEVEEAKGLGKIRGLMFSKRKNLILDLRDRRELIHGWFVFFSVKLYFLDSEFRILEKGKLKPFGFYFPRVKAKWLVEVSLF